jgi:F0F1-type ATP synthase delta subunit
VYTRFPLGLSELAEVKKITKSGDIQAKQHIDESVIGGFSAEYKGNLYDGTLGNQVTRLRSMLLR